MRHTYRITLISGLWRLMRDDALHSTYRTQAEAKAGMAHNQNRDDEGQDKAETFRSMGDLLAKLWQDATYSPDYNRELWEQFKDRFDDLYARAYAARKGE